MADTIKIKGGDGDVPALQDREQAYSKTEKTLYIGTNGTKEGNVRLCGANDVSELDAKIEALGIRIDDITARLEALEPSEEPSE